jgi:hypothetical protein
MSGELFEGSEEPGRMIRKSPRHGELLTKAFKEPGRDSGPITFRSRHRLNGQTKHTY